LKIKKSKNYPGSILLFLRDLKNCSGLGLRNPKKGNYEVGVKVRVCYYLGIRLGVLTKIQNGTKRFFYQGFKKTP